MTELIKPPHNAELEKHIFMFQCMYMATNIAGKDIKYWIYCIEFESSFLREILYSINWYLFYALLWHYVRLKRKMKILNWKLYILLLHNSFTINENVLVSFAFWFNHFNKKKSDDDVSSFSMDCWRRVDFLYAFHRQLHHLSAGHDKWN